MQIMKLLIMQVSPVSEYLLPLRPKCLSRQHVQNYLQHYVTDPYYT